MIAGQALLDMFLAATRWTQTIRYEVVSRSIIEPYAAIVAASAAWCARLRRDRAAGHLLGGTLAALAYAAPARAAASARSGSALRLAPDAIAAAAPRQRRSRR